MRISRLLRGANFPAANYSLAETRNALKSRLLICVKCPRCLPALLLVPSFSPCILLSLSPSAYFSPCDSRTRPSCALHHAYSCTLKLNSLAPVRSHNIPTFPYAVLDTRTPLRAHRTPRRFHSHRSLPNSLLILSLCLLSRLRFDRFHKSLYFSSHSLIYTDRW